MKCASCKKPMHVVYTRYEPRDGRNVQAEVQLKCAWGWTKGQPLRQHGGGRIKPTARYKGHGPFPPMQSIALCQDFGKWPPIIPDIDPETIYAVSFRDADDVNQWLDWWYSPEPQTAEP